MKTCAVRPALPEQNRFNEGATRFAAALKSLGWEKWAALSIMLFLLAVYLVSLKSPAVGLYHDDGIYAVTARALAEGRGYRLIDLPREIPQTKYPYLFPAALSLVWRLWPSFPENVTALKTLPFLCAVGWFVVTYKLLLRMGAKEVQARWTVLLAASSPLVIFLSTNLMSEPMFSALFTGALLAVTIAERSGSDDIVWLAGVLAALAFLTRTIGVSLLIAIPLALILKRRFKATRRFLLVSAPIAGTWPLWVYFHPADKDGILSYYSFASYSSWNIVASYSLLEKSRILMKNALVALVSPANLMGFPYSLWLVALTLAFMVGILLAARSRKVIHLDSVHLAVATYLLICLCWAWPPERFLIVILPLILFTIGETLWRLRLRGTPWILGAAALCFSLSHDFQAIHRPSDVIAAAQWRELSSMFSWLRANAPQDATVLADEDPAVFLYSDRKSVRNFIEDPVKLFYAQTPPASDPNEIAALVSNTSASFLLVTPDDGFSLVAHGVEMFVAAHPGVLYPVNRPGSIPGFQIYRIQRPVSYRQ